MRVQVHVRTSCIVTFYFFVYIHVHVVLEKNTNIRTFTWPYEDGVLWATKLGRFSTILYCKLQNLTSVAIPNLP